VKAPQCYGKETSITRGNFSKPLHGALKKVLIKNLRIVGTPINRLITLPISRLTQRKHFICTDKRWVNVRVFWVYYSFL
jgi:hypothetical protein